MARLRVDFSFLLMNSLMFMTGDGGMIAGFYGVCIAHELGHIAALQILGGKLRRVELTGFGIKMTAVPMPGIFRELVVLLSGPLVNIGIWLALEITGKYGDISRLSLLAGLYNLLPLPFLDGGAMLELLTASTGIRAVLAVLWAALVIAVYLFFT